MPETVMQIMVSNVTFTDQRQNHVLFMALLNTGIQNTTITAH